MKKATNKKSDPAAPPKRFPVSYGIVPDSRHMYAVSSYPNSGYPHIACRVDFAGIKDGHFASFWPKKPSKNLAFDSVGTKDDGRYKKNRKVGKWTHRDEKGKLKTESYYALDGTEVGFEIAYDDKEKPYHMTALCGEYYYDRKNAPGSFSFNPPQLDPEYELKTPGRDALDYFSLMASGEKTRPTGAAMYFSALEVLDQFRDLEKEVVREHHKKDKNKKDQGIELGRVTRKFAAFEKLAPKIIFNVHVLDRKRGPGNPVYNNQ